jgi:hypothetical protein
LLWRAGAAASTPSPAEVLALTALTTTGPRAAAPARRAAAVPVAWLLRNAQARTVALGRWDRAATPLTVEAVEAVTTAVAEVALPCVAPTTLAAPAEAGAQAT